MRTKLILYKGNLVHRLIKGVMTTALLLSAPLTARAERLEAVWIGPNGNGGAGDWRTPSNWNLGVVPNNGSDGNGDGVPDIFDARIDGGKSAMSSVADGAARIEVANLSIDVGDSLELLQPLGFVLSDPDRGTEINNDGSATTATSVDVTDARLGQLPLRRIACTSPARP